MGKVWKYALVQHPMWLIIAEDSVCAERTPPWGCESLQEYARRLDLSLETLERFPQLHLNFDFSAVELEDLAQRFPEMVRRMRDLTSQGRISFLNGTYSQPHLQILSLESAIRQFDYGVRAIEGLVGYRVTCYGAQEPGFTPQVPQILLALGYHSVSTPDFPFGVRLEGGQVQHWDKKWEWLAGDDIVGWRGLDGSTIPTWLKASGCPDETTCADDHQHGRLNRARLRVDMPDMVEVNSGWVREREKVCDFVQLDWTLAALARRPPQATAYIDANYAYLEGVDAEELPRANTRAETALLSLEAVETFLGAEEDGDYDFDAAWRILLKAQHHDVYWIGAPELRAKAIVWLNSVAEAAVGRVSLLVRRFSSRLPRPPEGSCTVVVVHPYARPHRMPAELKVGSDDCVLVDRDGNEVPVQLRRKPGGSSNAVFVTEARGLGYSTCFLRKGSSKTDLGEQPMDRPFRFSNRHYSAAVRPDGVIVSLAVRGGPALIGRGGGNVWLYQVSGKDAMQEGIAGSARIVRGPVFDAVEVQTRVGQVRLSSGLNLYHDLPWFTVDTRLTFDGPTEIGDYFDDRTKLHHAWHVGTNGQIRHALGCCPVEARPGRTFLVNPWLNMGLKRGGIAFCMFNATKCWLDEDGRLRCLVAWGHNGDRFHNRQGPLLPGIMGPLNWSKSMDLRLRGEHTVRYAVWPHHGVVDDGELADWAASLLLPPSAHLVSAGSGQMPCIQTFLSVNTPGIVPMSVRTGNDGEVLVRFVEMSGKSRVLRIEPDGWPLQSVCHLDGTPARRITPYKIVEARFVRKSTACQQFE